jgi:hypothetical protein
MLQAWAKAAALKTNTDAIRSAIELKPSVIPQFEDKSVWQTFRGITDAFTVQDQDHNNFIDALLKSIFPLFDQNWTIQYHLHVIQTNLKHNHRNLQQQEPRNKLTLIRTKLKTSLHQEKIETSLTKLRHALTHVLIINNSTHVISMITERTIAMITERTNVTITTTSNGTNVVQIRSLQLANNHVVEQLSIGTMKE